MKKLLILFYGVVSYLIGLTGLSAFMLYMGGWEFLPIHINSGIASSNTATAIGINLLILFLFALHHSVAARPGFKAWLNSFMPAAAERSTYVLISGLFMYAFCLLWQPLSGSLWSTDNSIAVAVLRVIHVTGWLVTVLATFEIDHFDLMGLKQSFNQDMEADKTLKETFLYRVVRHPIQTGILMGIWSTAYMSMTQFMLSAGLTAYIFIGLYYEEKSLHAHFGDAYLDYKKRVPGLIPFWPT